MGFTFYNQFKAKKYKAKAHEKSVQKVVRKLKQFTSRRWGVSNSVKAQKIAEVLRGWINYFKIGSILTITRKLDTMLRYRFRMCIWKHWKTPQNKFKNLVKLGVEKEMQRKQHGLMDMPESADSEAVCYAMSNARLAKFGLLSAETYFVKVSS